MTLKIACQEHYADFQETSLKFYFNNYMCRLHFLVATQSKNSLDVNAFIDSVRLLQDPSLQPFLQE